MVDLSGKRAKFIAMPGRVVVEPIEEERYGGLFLPTNRTERASIGTIVGFGCGVDRLILMQLTEDEDGESVSGSFDLLAGDVILFGQNSGMNVEVGLGAHRRRVIFLKESEIISKIEWELVELTQWTEDPWECSRCKYEGLVKISGSMHDELDCPRCGNKI